MAKFCIECGAHLEEGAKFCIECGARLSEMDPKPTAVVNRTVVPVKVAEPVQPAAVAGEAAPAVFAASVEHVVKPVKKEKKSKQKKQRKKKGVRVLALLIVLVGIAAGGYFVYQSGYLDSVLGIVHPTHNAEVKGWWQQDSTATANERFNNISAISLTSEDTAILYMSNKQVVAYSYACNGEKLKLFNSAGETIAIFEIEQDVTWTYLILEDKYGRAVYRYLGESSTYS